MQFDLFMIEEGAQKEGFERQHEYIHNAKKFISYFEGID